MSANKFFIKCIWKINFLPDRTQCRIGSYQALNDKVNINYFILRNVIEIFSFVDYFVNIHSGVSQHVTVYKHWLFLRGVYFCVGIKDLVKCKLSVNLQPPVKHIHQKQKLWHAKTICVSQCKIVTFIHGIMFTY